MASAIEGAAIPATQTSPKFIIFDTSSSVAKLVLNTPPYNILTVPMMTETMLSMGNVDLHSN